MNPKIEVVRMLVEKKGGVLAMFTAKVTFDGKYQVHFPNMKVVVGPKGRFVSTPTRKSGEDFIPHYFLNKELLDLVRKAGMDAYELAVKGSVNSTPTAPEVPVANKPAAVTAKTGPNGPAKPWVRKEWKPTVANAQKK